MEEKMRKLPMKRISPSILTIAMLGVSLGLAQLSFAEECANPKGDHEIAGKHHSAVKQELMKELNLTPEQEKQMAQQREQNKEKRKEIFTKMKEARAKLKEELNKPASNVNVIEKLKTQIKDAQGQMVDQEVEGILGLKKILTSEQFKTFSEKIQEKHKKFMEEGKKNFGKNRENISQGSHQE
jgi:Spy/CpxP family protein refolding chaperone